MPGRKKAEKLGIRDIAAAWKAGWTPDDVNALLDRFDQMGDTTDPPEEPEEDLEEDELEVEENDPSDDDSDNDDDLDLDDNDDNGDNEDDLDSNIEKLKKNSLEIENKRLRNELAKLKAKNRNKDVSGVSKDTKSPEDSLIDVFQSCF